MKQSEQLDIIEQEIAELEKEHNASGRKLEILRKSKELALKQQEDDKRAESLKEIDDLVNDTNAKLSETSIRFEHDQTLEAVLVKLDDSYLEEHFSTQRPDLKKISEFLDLFSNNVKAIEKIFGTFDESGDSVRLNCEDQKLESIVFNIHGRDEDIKIIAKDDAHLTVELSKGIEYRSDTVSVVSGGIEYSFYMVDSYDSFYIDASVSDNCKISDFDKTFEKLLNKLDEAKVVEVNR